MRRAAFAALALTGAAGLPAPAQNLAEDELSQQGSTISATISQRFEIDTNYGLDDPSPGTSYFTDTRIALGLLNVTPTQTLELGLDTGARALDEAEEGFDLEFASPTTARAAYAREWANAGIDADFRYRQSRVDFDRPLDDFIDPDTGVIEIPDDLEQLESDTTERRYDASVALALATDSPSSYEFTLTGNRFDYSDESSDRVPRSTVGASALWELRLTPLVSGAVFGSYSFYQADDFVETEIRVAELDAGLILRPSEVLELSGGIGYADRREEELLGGDRVTVEDDSGPTLRAGLDYAFQDFVVRANARISAAAPDTRLSGDIRLVYPMVRSRVDARLFQQYVGGSGGEEVRVTGAGFGLVREINTVSRIGFDLAAAFRENQDDPTEEDVTRFEAEAVYSYDLTEVVSADLGYRFQSVDEESEKADSHAVFVEIGRVFQTGL